MRFIIFSLFSLFIFISCIEKKAPETDDVTSPEEFLEYADFRLEIPASWLEMATTRLVEFTLEKYPQHRVTGFYFGPQEQSRQEIVETNTTRWEKQFISLEKKEQLPLQSEENAVLMYFTGTFNKKPFPMAEQGVAMPGYAVLVAIVHSFAGPYYFRLEAPQAVVIEEIKNFADFLNSYQRIEAKEVETPIQHQPIQSPVEPQQDLSGPTVEFEQFSLDIPEEWQRVAPQSNMRKAEFVIKESPEYRVVAFSFVSSFETPQELIDANIARWQKQFSKLEKEEKIELTTDKAVLVHFSGVYLKKPFPMAEEATETPGYAVLNAAVPLPENPYYFRLEAPQEIVTAQIENFQKFLNSYRDKN